MKVNKGSKGSPASPQAREAKSKRSLEKEEGAGHRGELSSPNPRRAAPPGTAEGPLSPKAPTGPRSRCKARPASFPVPSFLLPSPADAFLPLASVDRLCVSPWVVGI